MKQPILRQFDYTNTHKVHLCTQFPQEQRSKPWKEVGGKFVNVSSPSVTASPMTYFTLLLLGKDLDLKRMYT